MKKILLSILTFLGIGLSFCSASYFPNRQNVRLSPTNGTYITDFNLFNSFFCFNFNNNPTSFVKVYEYNNGNIGNLISISSVATDLLCITGTNLYFDYINSSSSITVYLYTFSFDIFSSCPDQLIDVQYNSGNTTTITCDGINYISIDGLSTLTNSNVNYEYTPYMNINYTDEDNQKLIESYDKSILYLDNGQFKKTYTGNNDWILTVQGGNSDNFFSGYLPIFDITGGIDEVSDSGNIFNNFAENSVKFTLSNIPSYIQYVIILMLLFFVLGIIRKFKRR